MHEHVRKNDRLFCVINGWGTVQEVDGASIRMYFDAAVYEKDGNYYGHHKNRYDTYSLLGELYAIDRRTLYYNEPDWTPALKAPFHRKFTKDQWVFYEHKALSIGGCGKVVDETMESVILTEIMGFGGGTEAESLPFGYNEYIIKDKL